MAMTKKEREAMDALIERVELVAALRWTEGVEKDVPAPQPGEHGTRYTEGWDFNVYSKEIWRYWSTSVSHGKGDAPKSGERYTSGSQNGRRLYSSELLAAKALRHALEKEAAAKLLDVDRRIAQLKSAAP